MVRVWLPAAWTPSSTAEQCRSQGFTEVQNPAGVGLDPCHYRGGSPALTITRLTTSPRPGGRRERINGIPVVTYSVAGLRNALVIIPTLDAVLTARDAAAAQIVTTLQRSLSWDFVHSPRRTSWPAGWRGVTYQGLTIDTPRSWQLQRVGYGPCGALGQDYPAVLRGTIDSASGCAAEAFDAIPTTRGAAWINPGPAPLPPTIGTAVIERHNGLTFSLGVVADSPAQVVIHISGSAHGTVELALSSKMAVPGRALASIR